MQEELFPFPVRHTSTVINPQTREYIDWRWSPHSVVMIFSAQLAADGGAHPFALYLPPSARVTQPQRVHRNRDEIGGVYKALSAGAHTSYVMVNRVKGVGVHPPPSSA